VTYRVPAVALGSRSGSNSPFPFPQPRAGNHFSLGVCDFTPVGSRYCVQTQHDRFLTVVPSLSVRENRLRAEWKKAKPFQKLCHHKTDDCTGGVGAGSQILCA